MVDSIRSYYFAPCRKVGHGRRRSVENCDARQATFWSVYYRDSEGLAHCIGDFDNAQSAKDVGEALANASDVELHEWSPEGEILIRPTDNRVYSEAETALCIYEDLLDSMRIQPELSEHNAAVTAWRENVGIYALRQFAIEIAPNIDAAWKELGGAGECLSQFDWEFVPRILRMLEIKEDGLTIPTVAEMVAEGRRLETELQARAAGWIAEREYNGEDDGVRHSERGDWAEDWEGAIAQENARAKGASWNPNWPRSDCGR